MDVLKHIPASVSEGIILTSFDVTNLDISILWTGSSQHWVEKHRRQIYECLKSNFIINVIFLVIEENLFRFDNKTYKQVKVTAMKMRFVFSYAILVMGVLGRKTL